MKSIVLLIIAAASVSLEVSGCSRSNGQPSAQAVVLQNGVLELPPKTNAAVLTCRPARMRVSHVTALLGRVDFDPNFVTSVYALVDGETTRILVNEGDAVRKGEVLAEVYSGNYASAVAEFQKAKSNCDIARKNLSRTRQLALFDIASQKNLEQAENDFQQATADYDRSLKTLQLLGGNEASTGATYRVVSPIKGTIIERYAQPGEAVRSDGNQPLFVVGSTRDVWVQLDVYQDQLRRVSVGDSVELDFDNDISPIRTIIRYLSPVIDEATFTTKARCELPNSRGLLKPQMFCTAKVFQYGNYALFIPSSSEFYGSDGRSYVFIAVGDGQYRKMEVTLGQDNGQMVEVRRGLEPDEVVVSNIPLLLDSELKLASQ